eukprot:4304027-Pyramimonas_sp.AAC.1
MTDALGQPPEARAAEIWKALDQVGPTLHAIAKSDQQFVALNCFGVFEFEVALLCAYCAGLRFTWAAFHFEPVWANPLWEWIGLDVSARLGRISYRMKSSTDAALQTSAGCAHRFHASGIPVGGFPP